MNFASELEVGQFVISKAGRDKSRIFIIVEKVDEVYVKIVDGDLRRVEHAKLKKVKHLNKMKVISNDIKSKIEDNKKISNLMIRKEIEKYHLISEDMRRD